MKQIAIFLMLLIGPTMVNADQLYILSKENAEKAAAYINEQKEVILFCGCCDNVEPIRVEVAEASVEPYKGYGMVVRVKGVNQYKNAVNEIVDLAYVWVKSKNDALNLGHVMGLRCNPCIPGLDWKKMEVTDKPAGTIRLNSEAIAHVKNINTTLNSVDTFGLYLDGNRYRVVDSEAKLDTSLGLYEFTFKAYYRGFNIIRYRIPLSAVKKVKGKKTYIILTANEGETFWLGTLSRRSTAEQTSKVNEIKLYLPHGSSTKEVAKSFKSLVRFAGS